MVEPQHERAYLLTKRGLYYGKGNSGYTGVKALAGRYLESDARPQSGVEAIHQDEAPLFSPSCWNEVKVEWLLDQITDRDAKLRIATGALEAASRSLTNGQPAICCTVWLDGTMAETLVDHIDAALIQIGGAA